MTTQPVRLFVYGSLRVGFRDPGYSYLSRYFHFVCEGKAKGRFYFTGSTPVAVPIAGEQYISGDLYELNNTDDFNWVIGQLDDYEGLNVDPGERPLYTRVIVDVITGNEPTEAWVYWYNGDVAGLVELDAEELAKYMQQQKKS